MSKLGSRFVLPVVPTNMLAQGHRLGPYRIVRLLGEGGMGSVYEARRDVIDLRVALKTLRPEYAREKSAVTRFMNEAKVLATLAHPSIAHASDFGVADDETIYLVMEYLEGQSLEGRLAALRQQERTLPASQAVRLLWQMADALATCHASGVIHRDLKPANVMLVADPVATGGERIKILDFGIAKFLQPIASHGPRTGTGEILGTPQYMPPEQFSSSMTVDEKSDVYSFGCVMYEVLSGRPLFVADESWQFVGMHMFQSPVPLAQLAPALPRSLCQLVMRMVDKDKDQRPTMRQVADELSQPAIAGTSDDAAGSLSHVAPGQPRHQATGSKPKTERDAGPLHKPAQRKRPLVVLAGLLGLGALPIYYSAKPSPAERPSVPPAPASLGSAPAVVVDRKLPDRELAPLPEGRSAPASREQLASEAGAGRPGPTAAKEDSPSLNNPVGGLPALAPSRPLAPPARARRPPGTAVSKAGPRSVPAGTTERTLREEDQAWRKQYRAE